MANPIAPKKKGVGILRPLPVPTGKRCPQCGGILLKRYTDYGVYIACVNYPNCGAAALGPLQPVKLTRKG